MHNDIHCEDYYDPKLGGEILSDVDVSEGRRNGRLLAILFFIILFIL